MKHRLLCLFALLFFLLGCTTAQKTDSNPDSQRLAQDVKEEIEAGRAMATKLAGSQGWYGSDSKLLNYINLVGQNLAMRSSRPELQFHFGILKSEEINAMSTPGGYVFVTLGLLKRLQSESELAAVLGHEIAHVTEKHMYLEIMPKHEVSTGEALTRALSRGGTDLGQSFSKAVSAGMDLLLEKGLGQEKEEEADRLGVLLATSAGYSGNSLYQYLSRISSQVQVAKTHPPFPKRLEDLNDFLKTNGIQDGKMSADSTLLDHRFKAALANLATSSG